MNRAALLASALALGVGVAGYAVTGSPRVPAAPAPPVVVDPSFTPEAQKASAALLENYGDIGAWITLSDALIRAGRTGTAIYGLETAIEAMPGNVDLWVQLGTALVAHAEGEVTPAARLAFDRAGRLDPAHPAPGYFLGLAWMQQGDVERAAATWAALAERAPADAPWKPMIERQVDAVRLMQKMGVGPGRAAVQEGPGRAAVQEGPGRAAVQEGPGRAAVQEGPGRAAVQEGPGRAAVQEGPGRAARPALP